MNQNKMPYKSGVIVEQFCFTEMNDKSRLTTEESQTDSLSFFIIRYTFFLY